MLSKEPMIKAIYYRGNQPTPPRAIVDASGIIVIQAILL